MLKGTSKVHELFREVHNIAKKKHDYDEFASILRELITNHVISGKMLLSEFFQKETAIKWLDYIAIQHGYTEACEFYTLVREPPIDFDIEVITNYTDNSDKESDEESNALSKKEKWMKLMTPIVKEFATKDIPYDALLKVLWLTIEDDEPMKCLYNMGKALYDKSASW